jgi:hypothetical protein
MPVTSLKVLKFRLPSAPLLLPRFIEEGWRNLRWMEGGRGCRASGGCVWCREEAQVALVRLLSSSSFDTALVADRFQATSTSSSIDSSPPLPLPFLLRPSLFSSKARPCSRAVVTYLMLDRHAPVPALSHLPLRNLNGILNPAVRLPEFSSLASLTFPRLLPSAPSRPRLFPKSRNVLVLPLLPSLGTSG